MRLVLALIVLLAGVATAAPDVPGALADLEAARDRLAHQQTTIEVHMYTIGKLRGEAVGQDKEIARLKEVNAADKRKAAEQLKRATSWTTNLMALTLGGVGVVALIGGGFFGFALRQWDIGTGGIALGISLMSLGAGIALYARPFAIGGLIVGGLFLLTFIAWTVIRARKREAGGVDTANIIPAAEKAGILAGDTLARMKALAYQMTGAMGDRYASLATGKPVSTIKSEADAAAAEVSAMIPAGR